MDATPAPRKPRDQDGSAARSEEEKSLSCLFTASPSLRTANKRGKKASPPFPILEGKKTAGEPPIAAEVSGGSGAGMIRATIGARPAPVPIAQQGEPMGACGRGSFFRAPARDLSIT